MQIRPKTLSPGLVLQAGEAFFPAEYFEHIEDAWRSRAPGERGAQRLRDIAELDCGCPA